MEPFNIVAYFYWKATHIIMMYSFLFFGKEVMKYNWLVELLSVRRGLKTEEKYAMNERRKKYDQTVVETNDLRT